MCCCYLWPNSIHHMISLLPREIVRLRSAWIWGMGCETKNLSKKVKTYVTHQNHSKIHDPYWNNFSFSTTFNRSDKYWWFFLTLVILRCFQSLFCGGNQVVIPLLPLSGQVSHQKYEITILTSDQSWFQNIQGSNAIFDIWSSRLRRKYFSPLDARFRELLFDRSEQRDLKWKEQKKNIWHKFLMMNVGVKWKN